MFENSLFQRVKSIIIVLILIIPGILIMLQLNQSTIQAKAESTWVQTTDKDFYNGTMENISIIDKGPDAELQIDLSDIKSWTKKTTQNRPIGGYYHVMASVWGTDCVVLFGGYWYYGGFWYYNETWVYDYSDNSWSQKYPSTKPSARVNHQISTISGTDKVLLFGGNYGSTYFDDTWVYDLSENKWTSMDPAGSKPTGRIYHSMAAIDGTDKVVLFGGYYTQLSDTWVYDLSENKWTEMQPSTSPNGRYYHSLGTIHGTDKVLLFGGYYYFYDDTWVYDLSENNWTRMFPSNRPWGRYYHTLAPIYGTDQIMMFGGYAYYINQYKYLNDTWIYDYSDNSWTRKATTNSPDSGWYSALAPIHGTDRVLLFGGYHPSYGYWDETWVYRHNLPTKNGTYISKPYDTKSNSSYNELSWYGLTNANSSIRLQLRSALNKSSLESEDFLGPDGKTDTFYTTTPAEIWSGHDGDRWIQYKVYLNIKVFTSSPCLRDITISYNCLPINRVVGPRDGVLLSNNRPTFSWTFEDIDSEEQKAFQVLIDDDIKFKSVNYDSGEQTMAVQRWDFPAGTSYIEIADGNWYWKVRTKDADGVWTSFSEPRRMIIDTSTPNSAATSPINNGFYNELNEITGIATDPEPSSGIVKVEIMIKRLIDNRYWSGLKWLPLPVWITVSGDIEWSYDSTKIPWESGNQYIIQTRAIDNVTNIEVPSNENIFTIDKDTPISNIAYPRDNIWLNKLDRIYGYAGDTGGSDVAKVEINIMNTRNNYYWYGKKWDSKEHWFLVIGTENWYYNSSEINWRTGDNYIIRSRVSDHANNRETPDAGITFKYDSIAPTSQSIYINNDDEFTTTDKVTLSLQAEDYDSSVAEMSFSRYGIKWSAWESYNNSIIYELPKGDGYKEVHYRVRDGAGNIARAVSDSIIMDTEPPRELSIVINSNDKYTNSKILTLTLNAIDSLSGISEVSFSYNGEDWLPWEPFKLTRTISVPNDDGEVRIYFRVMDHAGNIAEPAFDPIILDTTPPASLSTVINKGAEETNSTMVTLNIKAVDETSGISQIQFSVDGEFWSGWEEYTESKMYNLPAGNGLKTIFFRARDEAGNIAEPVVASILLNETTTVVAKEKSKPDSKATSRIDIWYILIILILIIFFILLTGMITRRMKRIEEQLIQSSALTIKPEALMAPETVSTQLAGAAVAKQLPASPVAVAGAKTGITAGAVAKPMLAKSTSTAQVAVASKSASISKLPQLPPAKIQKGDVSSGSGDNKSKNEEVSDLKPVQPPKGTSPEVHLPETTEPKLLKNLTLDQK